MQQLVTGLRAMGRDIGPAQLDKFEVYRDELLQWNSRVNLTSITDPARIDTWHFLDSLTVLQAIPDAASLRAIDIGSGAGFPGIPLKIALPRLRLVLLEATGKKVAFLNHMVEVLELDDTTVVHGRAEDVAHAPAHRESYDLVVARAVAPLATLAELCLPFAALGGQFIALKKGVLAGEALAARNAINLVGGAEARLVDACVPRFTDNRRLVCVTKVVSTPQRFPRRPGIPLKRPL